MKSRIWSYLLLALLSTPVAAAQAAPAETSTTAWSEERVPESEAEWIVLAQDQDEPTNEDEAMRAYRRAQRQLERRRYERAAELFEDFFSDHPHSDRAPRAAYWQAYALWKLDGGREEDALEVLLRLREEFPDADIRRDADELETRIRARMMSEGRGTINEEDLERSSEDCEDSRALYALQALLQTNSPNAVPILRKILERDDNCWEIRKRAVFVLSQQHGPETVEILSHVIRNDGHPEVREDAVFWLSQMPGDSSFEAIRHVLKSTNDEALLEKAIFALSQHRSRKSMEALRDFALDGDKPEELRANAIFWIGQENSRESSEFLRRIYSETNDTELRGKIVFGLSQNVNRENREFLRKIALDKEEDPEIRGQALFWSFNSQAIPCDEMSDLYWSFEDPEMRGNVLFGISQYQEDCALEALIKIARDEKDDELAETAIFWIGQHNDPRARQFLEELLTR